MAIARGPARPWIANAFLVVVACLLSTCGVGLQQALDVRARGRALDENVNRYATAPCVDPRVSARDATQVFERGARYRPRITCTFTADGVPYQATSEFNLLDRYRSSSEALERGRQWLAQRDPLTAYYDPVAPRHATLARDVRYDDVTVEVASSIAGLVLALCLWFVIARKIHRRVRARRRPPDEPIPGARVV